MTELDSSKSAKQIEDAAVCNDVGNQPWLSGVNLWIIVPTLLIVCGMFIYGLRLRGELLSVQAVGESKAASIQKLSRLIEEKQELVESIRKRQQNEKARLSVATRAVLSSVREVADLTAKGGEYVFYTTLKRPDGLDVFFYAPSGSHELTLDVGLRTSRSLPGGGHSTSTSKAHPRKVFKLPEGTRGYLKVNFENVGEKSIATATLIDMNEQQLEQTSYELPKRTAKGGMHGSSSGNHYYLPGDAKKPWFGNYFENLWHWSKTEQGMQTLCARVSLASQTGRQFVGIENVMPFLDLDNFDSMFEPEIKNNRLILTPAGEEVVRRGAGLHF